MTGLQDPAATVDRANGRYRGKTIARRFDSPDGFIILVGKAADDNDTLTFKVGRPEDFWLHVAGESGSHVIVLNDAGVERLPRATRDLAAALAARYSRAKAGGWVSVHLCQCRDVSKRRGAPAGEVQLRRWDSVKAKPVPQ
jgi:predicted ribosome quality control (RQC) complex YloA/Tae2 family protein